MALTSQNDEFYSGDRRSLNFTVKDGNDAVIDITGATFLWTCRRSVLSADAEISKVSGESPSEIDIVDAANGRVDVEIDPVDTAAISGDFYHELQMTDAQGNPTTVAFGTLTINQDAIQ
jgi:hypothetical protein